MSVNAWDVASDVFLMVCGILAWNGGRALGRWIMRP